MRLANLLYLDISNLLIELASVIFIFLLALYNFKISILAFATLLLIYFIIDFFIKKKINKISKDLYSSNLKSLSYAMKQ